MSGLHGTNHLDNGITHFDVARYKRDWKRKQRGTPVFSPSGELVAYWMPGNHGNGYLWKEGT